MCCVTADLCPEKKGVRGFQNTLYIKVYNNILFIGNIYYIFWGYKFHNVRSMAV